MLTYFTWVCLSVDILIIPKIDENIFLASKQCDNENTIYIWCTQACCWEYIR